MAKKIIIKCYKCGQVFEGQRLDDVVSANGLKKDGKRYSCDCKGVKEIAGKIGRKKYYDV